MTNPANATDKVDTTARKRIPMSIPQRKLEVPDVPGYHLHWFLERNVPRAVQGGYEMVQASEVALNPGHVGSSSAVSGNSDMGSNVSILGGTTEEGKPERLVLMKIREEWWREDQKLIEERNASVMSAIFRDEKALGQEGERADDRQKTYVGKALLQRPLKRVP